MSNHEKEFYKQKYLKYKSKYTELKDYKLNINSKQNGGLNEDINTYITNPPTIEDLFLSNKENVTLLEKIIINHKDSKEYLKKLKENLFIKNNIIDLLIKNNIIDLLISNKDYVIKYISEPYDGDRFNESGYDRDGYDRDGFNINGYDKYGTDQNGFNPITEIEDIIK